MMTFCENLQATKLQSIETAFSEFELDGISKLSRWNPHS
jgi:hypothetical protein